MHIKKRDLQFFEKIRRSNLINSLCGARTANLIGTSNQNGATNLAIFNSIMHLSSNPATMGFILRPHDKVSRDTFENILSTGEFTVNQVNRTFIEKAHYTSAKFPSDQSEFDACALNPEYIEDFQAPFVSESKLKIGLKYLESKPIEVSNVSLVIGEIQHIIVPEDAVNNIGSIDIEKTGAVLVGGLYDYYESNHVAQFPFARPAEVPEF